MQLLPVKTAGADAGALGDWPALEAIAGVVSSIGQQGFGTAALAQLNRWMPLCWWSVYTLFDNAPPTLHTHGSFDVADGTLESWRVYRASLYRRDETFVAARDFTSKGNTALLHWHAREIAPLHRAQIYSRHGLRERVSIVSSSPNHGMLAINLYRHETQAVMSSDAIDAIRLMAQPLLACVQRHIQMTSSISSACTPLDGLTRREKEVCERLLKGWTHEGIAADLGLKPTTVKTYRDRAFEQLNIHYRHELFALVAQRHLVPALLAPGDIAPS